MYQLQFLSGTTVAHIRVVCGSSLAIHVLIQIVQYPNINTCNW